MFDYLIAGAGLFGSVFAYEASRRGKNCLVIDKRKAIESALRLIEKEFGEER